MKSDKANRTSLLIIGPSIELHGIGGVTIHVQRLRDYLDKVGYRYDFLEYKSNHYSHLVKAIVRSELIHIHISKPEFQLMLVILCRLLGKKVILTLHGNYGRFSKLKNWMVRSALKLSNVPIVINEKSYEICKFFNKNTRLIPAFIPPQKEELLQQKIRDLLERLHSEGRKVVSTNAYNISTDKEGNDTYGIDFLVRFFRDSDEYALLVSDPSGNYHKRFSDSNSNAVHFIDYPHSYYELLKHVDYFVRNTSTDGDALSVKESLYIGKPTICSNVVDRPKGVFLFNHSDSESFKYCLKHATVQNTSIVNGADLILELYKNI